MLISFINLLKFIGSLSSSIYPTASFVCLINHYYVKQFFILSFALSVSRQLFGESIVCNSLEAKVPVDLIHTTCLINGTYTVQSDTGEIYHHDYYQWVSLYLLFLAFVFYAPYQMFSHWLTRPVPVCDNETQYDEIIDYMFRPKCHRHVFLKTLFVEIFYAIVILPAVAVLTHLFLAKGGGISWDGRSFPLNGNCAVTYFSGGFETFAVFHCLLPVNVVYRLVFKIAICAFWILAVLHVLSITYKIMLYCFPALRRHGSDHHHLFDNNIDIWWTYSIIENNTQGENLWRLKKALMNRRVSTITSKVTVTPLTPTVL